MNPLQVRICYWKTNICKSKLDAEQKWNQVCACETNLYYKTPPLLWCMTWLLQTQKPRCHFGAYLDHVVRQRLDCGQNQGLLSLSFSLASNSVPRPKERGSLPSCSYTHCIDAKTKARRGDFAWNHDQDPKPMLTPVSYPIMLVNQPNIFFICIFKYYMRFLQVFILLPNFFFRVILLGERQKCTQTFPSAQLFKTELPKDKQFLDKSHSSKFLVCRSAIRDIILEVCCMIAFNAIV